jgi:hypothetical protein
MHRRDAGGGQRFRNVANSHPNDPPIRMRLLEGGDPFGDVGK